MRLLELATKANVWGRDGGAGTVGAHARPSGRCAPCMPSICCSRAVRPIPRSLLKARQAGGRHQSGSCMPPGL
eukprot:2673740-Alexandrium_andersonii.AAC.1